MAAFSFPDIFIYFTIAFYLSSALLFQFSDKKKLSVFLLFLGCFCLSFYLANLDHFLYFWDEQYHALVAKNMMTNPFKPTLYAQPILDFNPISWDKASIWLHKPPLFLWQMALSMKIFGVNEMAVRLPSVLMLSLLVVLTFRIGKLTFNESIGYFAAFLGSLSYFIHEIAVGFFNTDHNDVAFLFYITCSLWAFVEYQTSKNRKWLLLIGLFAGCAVLVKWLVGLLVFAGWFFMIITNKSLRNQLKSYTDMAISIAVSVLVFLPWQIFILIKYPLESRHEFQLNAKHFLEVVEHHSGNFLFHFKAMNDIYGGGDLVPYLMLLSLGFFFYNAKNKPIRNALLFNVFAVYLFYTLAKTKMPAFTLIMAPVFFLAIASMLYMLVKLLDKILEKQRLLSNALTLLLLMSLGYSMLNINKLNKDHSFEYNKTHSYTSRLSESVIKYKEMTTFFNDTNAVIFNCLPYEYPNIMFYTGMTAYGFMPDLEHINRLKKENKKIIFFNDKDLPDYIAKDSSILKLSIYHN